ncbi:MAG: PqqD family protein [Candidatus Aminicenantes bacterium]|nr:PqqD family protein [Candidatus Aminicenantes bacterium]
MSRLSKLAVNAEGFVFDPDFGDVFTVNPTGLSILDGMRNNKPAGVIAEELKQKYGVTLDEVEKDIFDFNSQLRLHRLT